MMLQRRAQKESHVLGRLARGPMEKVVPNLYYQLFGKLHERGPSLRRWPGEGIVGFSDTGDNE
jgi:hypothetical protein